MFVYTLRVIFTGTPLYNGSVREIIYAACKEAEVYLKCTVVSSEHMFYFKKKNYRSYNIMLYISSIIGWFNCGKYV